MLVTIYRPIFRKWAIIAVLLGAVYVFANTDNRSIGFAAPCIEECEDNLASCRDECISSCDETSSRESCDSCVMGCNQPYLSCLGSAVWCDIGNSYTPNCTVQYGSHCPIISGQPNCAHPSAYNAYFLIFTQGGNQCVSCPSFRYCSGSGGVGPCIPD